MPPLDDKVALITGGTGALGTVVCREFLAAGARLAVTYVLDEEVARFKAAVPSGDYALVKTDLAQAAQVSAAVDEIVAARGRIDVLLNLAGGFWGGVTIAETPDLELEKLFTMNVRTAFNCARAVVPQM